MCQAIVHNVCVVCLWSFPVFPPIPVLQAWQQIAESEEWRWRRQWQATPVLLPGKSLGWRSLVGCSPWGCEESDTTEWLHFDFSLSCIGERNGNPLPGMAEPGGLPSLGSHRVRHDWSDLAAAAEEWRGLFMEVLLVTSTNRWHVNYEAHLLQLTALYRC